MLRPSLAALVGILHCAIFVHVVSPYAFVHARFFPLRIHTRSFPLRSRTRVYIPTRVFRARSFPVRVSRVTENYIKAGLKFESGAASRNEFSRAANELRKGVPFSQEVTRTRPVTFYRRFLPGGICVLSGNWPKTVDRVPIAVRSRRLSCRCQ